MTQHCLNESLGLLPGPFWIFPFGLFLNFLTTNNPLLGKFYIGCLLAVLDIDLYALSCGAYWMHSCLSPSACPHPSRTWGRWRKQSCSFSLTSKTTESLLYYYNLFLLHRLNSFKAIMYLNIQSGPTLILEANRIIFLVSEVFKILYSSKSSKKYYSHIFWERNYTAFILQPGIKIAWSILMGRNYWWLLLYWNSQTWRRKKFWAKVNFSSKPWNSSWMKAWGKFLNAAKFWFLSSSRNYFFWMWW